MIVMKVDDITKSIEYLEDLDFGAKYIYYNTIKDMKRSQIDDTLVIKELSSEDILMCVYTYDCDIRQMCPHQRVMLLDTYEKLPRYNFEQRLCRLS